MLVRDLLYISDVVSTIRRRDKTMMENILTNATVVSGAYGETKKTEVTHKE